MSEDTPGMRKPLAPIAAAATGLCIGLSAGTAGAGQPTGNTPPSSSREADIDVQVPDSVERVGSTWTQDRMRAAKPMPTPRISRTPEAPKAGEEAVDQE